MSPQYQVGSDWQVASVMQRRGIEPWPYEPNPENRRAILDSASSLRPEDCHPFRLKLICNQLAKISSDKDFADRWAECDRQIDRLSSGLRDGLNLLLSEVRAGDHDKKAFLRALNYPLITSAELEDNLQDFLFGNQNIRIFNDGSDLSQEQVRTSSGEFAFISTELKDLVTFLSAMPINHLTGKLLDIGCGAGSVAITLALTTGMEVCGIDRNLRHVRTAQVAADACRLKGLNFETADALDYDYSGYDVYFIYSPFHDKAKINSLLSALEQDSKGRQIEIWAPDLKLLEVELGQQRWLMQGDNIGDITIWRSRG